jgi:hypothetical protein
MKTISFRSDSEVERALAQLMMNGRSQTAVIKSALLLAAETESRVRLAADAAALASDPDDLAEIRAVREDMDTLRAW